MASKKPNAPAKAKPKAKKPRAKPSPPRAKHGASKPTKEATPPPAEPPAPAATVAQQRSSNGETPNGGADEQGRLANGRFGPGNTVGWVKGQSGHPEGPKKGERLMQKVTLEMLWQPVPGDIRGRLWVEVLIEKAFVEALRGNDKFLALIHKFTGEGLALKLTHEGEVTLITPEEMEVKRKARMAQVAEALVLASQMEEAGDMAADIVAPDPETDLPPEPAPGRLT